MLEKGDRFGTIKIPPRSITSGENLELITFLKKNEDYVSGVEVARRAARFGASCSLKDALYLLEHQYEIPHEFREYKLLFPRVGSLYNIGAMDFINGCWRFSLTWCGDGFGFGCKLVRPY